MSRYLYVAAAAAALAFAVGPVNAQTPQTAPTAPPAAAPAGTFTDAQLQTFAAASIEIDPISRALPTATPEQRTQATAQIRAILQRHQIDAATYNAIAQRAQTDAALAARIAALQTSGPHDGAAPHNAPSGAAPPRG